MKKLNCRQCREWVEEQRFYRDGKRKTGLCRDCHERNVRRDASAINRPAVPVGNYTQARR